MDLLKTTLNNPDIYVRYKKISGPLMTRNFVLTKNLNNYNCIDTSQNVYEKIHRNSVLQYANTARQYIPILPNSSVKVDTHFELERAGLGDDMHKFRTVVSFRDSLDFILHKLCGVSYQKVYTGLGSQYYQVSRALLMYSNELMGNLGFESLINLDPKLDEYLTKLLAEQESSTSNFSYVEMASHFFDDLFVYTQGYATFLGAFLQAHFKEQGISLVFKSVSATEVILATDTPINETIELTDGYLLNVISYAPSDVLKTLDHNFRGSLEVV